MLFLLVFDAFFNELSQLLIFMISWPVFLGSVGILTGAVTHFSTCDLLDVGVLSFW